MTAATLVAAVALWLAAVAAIRRLYRAGRLQQDLHVDLAAIGLLAVLNGAFFWRLIAGGAWMPEGGGDMAAFLLPMYRYAAWSLRAGDLPLWNPYWHSGAPFAADIQAGMFYPVNLAAFALVPRLTIHWLEALSAAHYVVAGTGMYCLLRFMRPAPARLARAAAVLAAVAFMWSDLFVTHFGNTNLLAVAAWLPWSFLGLHRALESPTARNGLCWSLAAGLAIAMAGLGGHAQPLAYTLLALAGYTAVHAAGAVVGAAVGPGESALGDTVRGVAADVGLAAAAMGLGLGLAAVALVPAVELVGHTRRADLGSVAAAEYSLPPELLSGLVAPGVFGRGMQQYWGPWPRVETGYIGVAAMALAIVGVALLLARCPSLRGTPGGYFALLAVVALLLALGEHGPLYDVARRWLPGLAGMRAPARFVFLTDFGLAALAGLALHALLQERRATVVGSVRLALAAALAVGVVIAAPGVAAAVRLAAELGPDRLAGARVALASATAVFAATAAVLALYLHGRLGRRALAALLVGLVAGELFASGSSLDWAGWDPTHNLEPPAMEFLAGDPGLYRVEVRPEVWGWWSPGATLNGGEYDVSGVYNPLQLADYELVWESLTDRSMPLYDFLNVKYVVGPKDFALPWDEFVPVYDADEHVNIYLNRESMPRAIAVRSGKYVADHEAAWAAIREPGFDPARQVILERADPAAGDAPQDGAPGDRALEDSASQDSAPGDSAPGDATTWDGVPGASATVGDGEWSGEVAVDITGYRNDSIEVRVELPDPGYLVLSETFYPGWDALVDGEAAPILRANYAFRAIELPAGAHDVRLRFRPRSVWAGAAVSLATATLALVAALGCRRALAVQLGAKTKPSEES
ncbi:MAG: YfhO family protein [Anaerolineae bacterium]